MPICTRLQSCLFAPPLGHSNPETAPISGSCRAQLKGRDVVASELELSLEDLEAKMDEFGGVTRPFEGTSGRPGGSSRKGKT